MKKKQLKISKQVFWMAGLALAFLFCGPAGAQEQDSGASNAGDGGVVVADVSIRNARIVSQAGSRLKIAFDLFNGDQAGFQPDVRYAVQLAAETEKGYEMMDEAVFAESVDLGINQKVSREVEYSAPEYLSGEYRVLVSSGNSKGLPLAQSPAGVAELQGSGEHLSLGKASCTFKVDGKNQPERITKSGIHLEGGESLDFSCAAMSSFQKDVTASPLMTVKSRSIFGDTVSERKAEAAVFEPGKSKSFSGATEIPQNPGNYILQLALQEEGNNVISDTLTFNFRVSGPHATVSNLVSDRETYQKGEAARATAYWSGFSAGAVSSQMDILGSGGQKCAETKINPHDKFFGGREFFETALTDKCPGGRIVLSIKDESGKVLDESILNFRNLEGEQAAQVPEKNRFLLYVFLAAIVSAVLVGAVLIKYRRSGSVSSFFFLLLVSGIFLSAAPGAEALTRCSNITTGGGGGNGVWQTADYCFTMNLDDSGYCPEDMVLATVSYSMNCQSYDFPLFGCDLADHVRVDTVVNGSLWSIDRGGSDFFLSRLFTAPSQPGPNSSAYRADFQWQAYDDASIDSSYRGVNYSGDDPLFYYVFSDCSVPPPPQDPPPPSGTNPLPEGYYNGSNNTECSLSGWARDASAPNQSVGIRIFRGGRAPFDGGTGTLLASGRADVPFGGAVGNHGFRFSFRGTGMDDGNSRVTYAYADDIPNSDSKRGLPLAIGGSRYLQCSPVVPETPPEPPTCNPGPNTFNCFRTDPICDRSSCGGQVSGSVSCSYSNSCGTFNGMIDNGRCGNVPCVPSTITCDCEKWREVAP